MKDQTVLVKRSIEKDGQPKKSTQYVTDIGIKTYHENGIWFGVEECEEITYWYEEVPLSSLIESRMPTESGIQEYKIWRKKFATNDMGSYKVVEDGCASYFGEPELFLHWIKTEWFKTQLTSKP